MTQDQRNDDFGGVLRTHRLLAGLTQEDLAYRSGVAVRTISDLERGKVSRPQRQTVDRLARVLVEPGAGSALVAAARAAGLETASPIEAGPWRPHLPGSHAPAPHAPGSHAPGSHARGPHAPVGGTVIRPLPIDPVPGFVGREQELAKMNASVLTGGQRLLVLSGPPGVGKTSIARQWSYRAAGEFADGCLFIDLRGYSGGEPMPVAEALAGMLRLLGTPADKVPADQDDAEAMLRDLAAGRRLIVILDNARDSVQARPLIMTTPSVATIVTSRAKLPGLVVSHAARTMLIPVMSRAESINLLTRLVGPDLSQPAADLDPLARACADLPLALRIAAAQLSTMAFSSAHSLADRIAGTAGLGALALRDEQTAIWAAFDASYQALGEDARHLFLMLGLAPIADFSLEIAGVLADRSLVNTAATIAELVNSCLLHEVTPDRYTCHDLLRSFAADLADRLPPADQRHIIARVRDHLVGVATSAAALLYPQMTRLPASDRARDGLTALSSALSSTLSSNEEAREWLDREVPGIVRIIRHAALDPQAPESSWLLTDALRGWFFHQRPPDWVALTETALAAARAAGDTHAIAAMHANLGLALQSQGRWTDAADEFEETIAQARRCGWTECLAAATGNLGSVRQHLGDLDRARDLYLEALELNRAIGNLGGQAIRLSNLGGLHRKYGDLELAESCYWQALRLYERVGSLSGQSLVLVSLGNLAIDRLDSRLAHQCGADALNLAEQSSSIVATCLAHRLMSDAARIADDPVSAAALAAQALTESEAADDPRLAVDCLVTLAAALVAGGQYSAAAPRAREAAELATAIGYSDGLEIARRTVNETEIGQRTH